MSKLLAALAGAALILNLPAAAADGSYEEGLALYDEAAALRPADDETFARAQDLYGQAYAIWIAVPESERPPAMRYHLAMLYYLGAGDVKINQPLAMEMFEAAAAEGYPLADAFIGFLHERGDGMMVSNNQELALERYERAAAGNNCAALKRLAAAYRDGDLGLRADAPRAEAYAARIPDCVRR